jgi:hypothetical protein
MDEAERCHKLGYILNGRLLAQGTADDIIASQSLAAWSVAGPALHELAPRLRALPAVDQVAAFGSELHITGTEAAALEAALAPFKAEGGRRWQRIEPGLEDVFIHLMQSRRPRRGARRRRRGARAHEWILLVSRAGSASSARSSSSSKRDRLTFGMIVGIPIIQLVLFGFAINSDPKRLPTMLLDADRSEFSRSIVSALANSNYFAFIGEASGEDEADRALATGRTQFVVTIPTGLRARCCAASARGAGRRPTPRTRRPRRTPSRRSTGSPSRRSRATSPVRSRRSRRSPARSRWSCTRATTPEAITQYNIVPGLMGVILTMTMV